MKIIATNILFFTVLVIASLAVSAGAALVFAFSVSPFLGALVTVLLTAATVIINPVKALAHAFLFEGNPYYGRKAMNSHQSNRNRSYRARR